MLLTGGEQVTLCFRPELIDLQGSPTHKTRGYLQGSAGKIFQMQRIRMPNATVSSSHDRVPYPWNVDNMSAYEGLHNDLTSYHVTVHGGQYIRPCPYLSQSVPAAGGRMSISNDKLSIVSSNHKRSAGNPCTYQHHSMNPEGTVCLLCVCVCVPVCVFVVCVCVIILYKQ